MTWLKRPKPAVGIQRRRACIRETVSKSSSPLLQVRRRWIQNSGGLFGLHTVCQSVRCRLQRLRIGLQRTGLGRGNQRTLDLKTLGKVGLIGRIPVEDAQCCWKSSGCNDLVIDIKTRSRRCSPFASMLFVSRILVTGPGLSLVALSSPSWSLTAFGDDLVEEIAGSGNTVGVDLHSRFLTRRPASGRLVAATWKRIRIAVLRISSLRWSGV